MSITIGALTLTEFSDKENSRTWVTSTHAVSKPRVVIQRRKVPDGSNGKSVQTSELSLAYGTEDADGLPMSSKINIDLSIRYPVGALLTDVQAAVDALQVLVASANFDSLAEKQLYLG